MSLETALAANTAAILKLVEVMTYQAPTFAPANTKMESDGLPPIDNTAQTAAPSPVAAPVQTKSIEYADLASLVLSRVKGNRAAVLEALSAFGVKTAKELAPEQYAAAYAAIESIPAAAA